MYSEDVEAVIYAEIVPRVSTARTSIPSPDAAREWVVKAHYVLTELSTSASWHSPATKIVYREFLDLWIRPYWSTTDIHDVRTVAVEQWLSQLRRHNKEPLCNSTKAKIRSLMSVLFNHAIRYEWLEQGKNPITFVRQSAERLSTPEVLEPAEIQRLLSKLGSPYDLMALWPSLQV